MAKVVKVKGSVAFRFVCPWCGEGQSRRSLLSAHWLVNPQCNANKFVNSPMQKE